MISSFGNLLNASFNLFANNSLQYFASGFSVVSGNLYPTTDNRYSQYQIYGGTARQWCCDSSIPGVVVPSGIYDNGNFIPTGVSGLTIDFERGRILYSGTQLSSPSLEYSPKDFNIYYSNDPLDEPILFITGDVFPIPNQALTYYQQTIPAIYFQSQEQYNDAAALGKLQNANAKVECLILAPSTWELDACLGALSDTARKYFPLVDLIDLPFNSLGGLKNGAYNYQHLVTGQQRSVFIENVRVTKKDENFNKRVSKSVWSANVVFDLVYQFQNV